MNAFPAALYWAFRIIILLRNERLLIAFLVPSYLSFVAASITVLYILKYIFIYKYIYLFISQQYKEQCVTFYQI